MKVQFDPDRPLAVLADREREYHALREKQVRAMKAKGRK